MGAARRGSVEEGLSHARDVAAAAGRADDDARRRQQGDVTGGAGTAGVAAAPGALHRTAPVGARLSAQWRTAAARRWRLPAGRAAACPCTGGTDSAAPPRWLFSGLHHLQYIHRLIPHA